MIGQMTSNLTHEQARIRMPKYALTCTAIRNDIGKPSIGSPSSQRRAQWQS
ncbi:hypothetical protein HAP47_0033000 [Bradyrhizobium sp. 41S5]|uniref:hypothetical protein n=1 Tax=Bradyrhizobium sp. 41S5 TaxID=1404443 RepID=UPI00156ABF8C|nr:hypothetical protein [Bradyrhizobium sp. 41S5]UFX43980.1 hypothetical protein HAP47_0033000 [Bradyrhizobium sp. 41S5]